MRRGRSERALEYANRGCCPQYDEFDRVWLRMLVIVFRRKLRKF